MPEQALAPITGPDASEADQLPSSPVFGGSFQMPLPHLAEPSPTGGATEIGSDARSPLAVDLATVQELAARNADHGSSAAGEASGNSPAEVTVAQHPAASETLPTLQDVNIPQQVASAIEAITISRANEQVLPPAQQLVSSAVDMLDTPIGSTEALIGGLQDNVLTSGLSSLAEQVTATSGPAQSLVDDGMEAVPTAIAIIDDVPQWAVEEDLSDLLGSDPSAGIETLTSLLTISDIVELPTPDSDTAQVVQTSSAALVDALAFDDGHAGLVPDAEGELAEGALDADASALMTPVIDPVLPDDLHLGLG